MTRFRLVLLLFPLLVSLSGLSGCASSSSASVPDAGNVDANGNAVSSVPWNKPESWETQGELSGMAGH